jgi:hypothetical protein
MDPIKESTCSRCNQRIISYPDQLCRRQFLFPSQHQTEFNNIQTNIINKSESIGNGGSRTSGNSKLDGFIKETQLNSKYCDDFIEWIPYSNLENIKFLTNGGNSKIYFGTWLLDSPFASKQSTKVTLKTTDDFEIRNNDIPIEVKKK